MNINITKGSSLRIVTERNSISFKPKKKNGIDVSFGDISSGGLGNGVVRCTIAEYEALASYDSRTIYAVTTTDDKLKYIYIGSVLVKEVEDEEHAKKLVSLSEKDYRSLPVKDPNTFYFTFEDYSAGDYIKNHIFVTRNTIENHKLKTSRKVENHILTI